MPNPARSSALDSTNDDLQRDSLECLECEQWLAEFVSGEITSEHRRSLRRHVVVCATCASRYQESLSIAAHIGHERRLGREEGERLRRRRQRLSDARGASLPSRAMILRTVAFPAFLIFFLARGFSGETQARVRILEGTTFLGERELSTLTRPQPVQRGDWIVTPADASARIERGGGVGGGAHIEAGSFVCVEDSKLERLLLHGGKITVDAPCTVNSPFGSVEVSTGSAVLSVDDVCLEVEVLAGSATALNARGARTLAIGERARLLIDGL